MIEVPELDTITERSQPAAREVDRPGVEVASEKTAVRRGGAEDRLGMAARTDRPVDPEPSGTAGERFQRLLEEDRLMG